jgi:hypothetical protein
MYTSITNNVTEVLQMRKFKISSYMGTHLDGINSKNLWDVHIVDEKLLIAQAKYYRQSSEILEDDELNLDDLDTAIAYLVRGGDIVEDITEPTLEEFTTHFKKSVTQIFDILDIGGDLDKFDLKIQYLGKTISLPVHADLFDRFTTFLEEEIEENNQ